MDTLIRKKLTGIVAIHNRFESKLMIHTNNVYHLYQVASDTVIRDILRSN